MQIISISELNAHHSASFGKKESTCCPNIRDNSTITVPRVVYINLLGMVMLAMAIIGTLTGCEKDDPIPDVQEDTVAQSPVQKNFVNMLQGLGLLSVTATTKSVS